MAESFYLGDLSTEEVKSYLTPQLVLNGYDIFFRLAKSGETSGQKCFQYLPQELLWKQPAYAMIRGKFKDAADPLEWRYNVAESWITSGLIGSKEIFSNIINEEVGLPRHMASITIRSLFTGVLFGRLDGIDISNARSVFPSLKMMDLCFIGMSKINIFIFGAQGLAEWHVRLFAHGYASKISRITICSPKRDNRPPSSFILVEKMKNELNAVPFELVAVVDHKRFLPSADFVIGTSNAGSPLFAKAELAPHARTMSYSTDEMPAEHIEDVLTNGKAICMDIKACSARGGQSLQLWFERRGERMADKTEEYGILELAKMVALADGYNKPVHCTSVGVAAQDLIVGALVLLKRAEAEDKSDVADLIRNGLSLS